MTPLSVTLEEYANIRILAEQVSRANYAHYRATQRAVFGERVAEPSVEIPLQSAKKVLELLERAITRE